MLFVQPTGKLIGIRRSFDESLKASRFFPSGILDSTFGGSGEIYFQIPGSSSSGLYGQSVAFDQGANIYVGTINGVAKFDAEGRAKGSVRFSRPTLTPSRMAIAPNGDIVVAGNGLYRGVTGAGRTFGEVAGNSRGIGRGMSIAPPNDLVVARYKGNGTIDTSFGDEGVSTLNFAAYDRAFDMRVSPTGEIHIIASGDNSTKVLVVLTADGALAKTSTGSEKTTLLKGPAHAAVFDREQRILFSEVVCSGSGAELRVGRLNPYDHDKAPQK